MPSFVWMSLVIGATASGLDTWFIWPLALAESFAEVAFVVVDDARVEAPVLVETGDRALGSFVVFVGEVTCSSFVFFFRRMLPKVGMAAVEYGNRVSSEGLQLKAILIGLEGRSIDSQR